MASGAANSCKSSALALILLLSLLGPSQNALAVDYTVGGASVGWRIQASNPTFYSTWASQQNFQVGDALVFLYDASLHNVLRVSETGFQSCSLDRPLNVWSDGDTKVVLTEPGQYYFISGKPGHCEAGMQMALTVPPAAGGPMAAPVSTPAYTTPSLPPVSTISAPPTVHFVPPTSSAGPHVAPPPHSVVPSVAPTSQSAGPRLDPSTAPAKNVAAPWVAPSAKAPIQQYVHVPTPAPTPFIAAAPPKKSVPTPAPTPTPYSRAPAPTPYRAPTPAAAPQKQALSPGLPRTLAPSPYDFDVPPPPPDMATEAPAPSDGVGNAASVPTLSMGSLLLTGALAAFALSLWR